MTQDQLLQSETNQAIPEGILGISGALPGFPDLDALATSDSSARAADLQAKAALRSHTTDPRRKPTTGPIALQKILTILNSLDSTTRRATLSYLLSAFPNG